ncbi:hypothetical protein NQ318_000185 [Aromia moschata]|uniref:Mos1 transposase HTH domain-containing protein n=1 Tax=Aromia moschata TaxID=1265417 RepID=A0AAV8YIU1_9CUCU|nr:hypothetical protein NQ318_000185 [Aromia moschata]
MSIEQRANIKFCFKLGKTFTETHQLMKQVYGDDCLSRGILHAWFTRFKEGRESLEDDPHVGQPKSVITPDTRPVERIRSTGPDSQCGVLSWCYAAFAVKNSSCSARISRASSEEGYVF